MSSNKQLIAFFQELENALQASLPDSVDYFPALRSHVYFANRREGAAGQGREDVSSPGYLWQLVAVLVSLVHLLAALVVPGRATALFVAPAQHRNIRTDHGTVSKHLDSLLERYTEDADEVWEVGAVPGQSLSGEPLAMRVSRIALLLATVFPAPARIRQMRPALERAVQKHFAQSGLTVDEIERALASFEYAQRYYRTFFARGRVARGLFVVYYSRRHLPIISALNALGRPTLEYQHGIQNNLHPMYTHWEHLHRTPSALPSHMLLWNDVTLKRIERWGQALGLKAEVIGNLWYARQPAIHHPGSAVMVALQHYPRYFCPAILEAMDRLSEVSWVFREHPIYRLTTQQKDALARDRSNVVFVGSEDEPLEDTLGRCFCCVTGFSTVGLEALMCNRIAIFTHENARDGLADYIDNRTCFFADTPDAIVQVVSQALPTNGAGPVADRCAG